MHKIILKGSGRTVSKVTIKGDNVECLAALTAAVIRVIDDIPVDEQSKVKIAAMLSTQVIEGITGCKCGVTTLNANDPEAREIIEKLREERTEKQEDTDHV